MAEHLMDDSRRITARYALYALAVLFFVNVLNYADRLVIGALLDPIGKEFGLAHTPLGSLGTAFIIVYAVTALPFALWSDRGVRKNIVALGMAACAVATMANAFANDFGHLFWTRALVGLGEALCLPSALALISDYFPRRHRTKVIAVFAVGMFIGSALGLSGGAVLIHYLDWRTVMLVTGAPGIPLALMAFFLREPVKGAMDSPMGTDEGPPPSFWILFRIRSYWIICAAIALLTAATGALLHWLLQFEEIRETAAQHSTTIASAIALGGCLLGATLSGIIGDNILRRTRRGLVLTVAMGLILGAPPLFIYLLSDARFIYLPALGLAGFFLSWSAAPMGALVHSLVEPRLRATALALFTFAIHVFGDAPSPIVVGALSDFYAAKAVNLVENPSFQDGWTDGDGPAGWRVSPAQALGAATLDPRAKPGGKRPMRLVLADTDAKSVVISQRTPMGSVRAGQMLAALVLCRARLPGPRDHERAADSPKDKAEPANGVLSLTVTFTDASGAVLHRVQGDLAFSQLAEWDSLEVQAAAPDEARQAELTITATGTGTVWLSDASLSEAPLRKALFLLPGLALLGGLVCLLALKTVAHDMDDMQRRVAERRRLALERHDE